MFTQTCKFGATDERLCLFVVFVVVVVFQSDDNLQIKTEVITCIRMAESVDYVLAAGTRSGKMFVFQLPSLLPGRAKQVLSVSVQSNEQLSKMVYE